MGGQQEHIVKGQADGRELVVLVVRVFRARRDVVSHGTFSGK
jgi:hypothetical protein